jgi:hypothetical protein
MISKILHVLLILLLSYNFVVAQGLSDTITVYKNRKFYQNLHQLNLSELSTITKNNENAYLYIQKAKGYSGASTAVVITGAAIALGGIMANNLSVKLVAGGIGIGIELVGLLISTGVRPNIAKGVKIFNEDLKNKYGPVSYHFKTGFTENGFALIFTF